MGRVRRKKVLPSHFEVTHNFCAVSLVHSTLEKVAKHSKFSFNSYNLQHNTKTVFSTKFSCWFMVRLTRKPDLIAVHLFGILLVN